MKKFKFVKPYPLFKLVKEEIPDRNDNKSIRFNYEIFVKTASEGDWLSLYNTFSEPWSELAFNKIRNIFETEIIYYMLDADYFPMFEVNDQIYKTTFVFPEQSCISGENIKGNVRYGEFSTEPIKFDYIQSTVFPYRKGTCLIKSNQMFIDGELIYDSKGLAGLCSEIGQLWYQLDSSPDILIKYIKENYKNVNTYTCNFYTRYDIN